MLLVINIVSPSLHEDNLSRVVRKPALCICENKDADQLHGNREADQRLCFRYTDSTIPLLLKPLAIFCDCTARFVSDLAGNPKDRFSHNEAHFYYGEGIIALKALGRDCTNNNGLTLQIGVLSS